MFISKLYIVMLPDATLGLLSNVFDQQLTRSQWVYVTTPEAASYATYIKRDKLIVLGEL